MPIVRGTPAEIDEAKVLAELATRRQLRARPRVNLMTSVVY